MGKNTEDVAAEMMEYVCDNICRFPREIYDQEQLAEICEGCKIEQYVSKIRKENTMKRKSRWNVNISSSTGGGLG